MGQHSSQLCDSELLHHWLLVLNDSPCFLLLVQSPTSLFSKRALRDNEREELRACLYSLQTSSSRWAADTCRCSQTAEPLKDPQTYTAHGFVPNPDVKR